MFGYGGSSLWQRRGWVVGEVGIVEGFVIERWWVYFREAGICQGKGRKRGFEFKFIGFYNLRSLLEEGN